MKRQGEDEWVSEKGTSRVMALVDEPHSLNEMKDKQPSQKSESKPTSQPATEEDTVKSDEPSESADQKAASMATLSARLDGVNEQQMRMAFYGLVFVGGVLAVNKVMN